MTTYASSASIIHAVTRTGYTGDVTRCCVLLPKGRERVRHISEKFVSDTWRKND